MPMENRPISRTSLMRSVSRNRCPRLVSTKMRAMYANTLETVRARSAPRFPRTMKAGGATSLITLGMPLALASLLEARSLTRTTPRNVIAACRHVIMMNIGANSHPPREYICRAAGSTRKTTEAAAVHRIIPVWSTLIRDARFLFSGKNRGSE